MWSVVEFEDGLQLVPLDWLNKASGACMWPPYTNQIKIDKSIKNLDQPGQTWTTHQIKKIFGNADSYEVGLKKLKKAELTSDLETENEDIGKKERKNRARKIFESDSSEDEGVGGKPKKPKSFGAESIPVPKLSFPLIDAPEPSSHTSETTPKQSTSSYLGQYLEFSAGSSKSSTWTTPKVTKSSSNMSNLKPCTSRSSLNSPNERRTTTPTKVVKENGSCLPRKLSPQKNKKILESDQYGCIMRKLNTILYEVKKLDQRLTAIENKPNEEVSLNLTDGDIHGQFPITNMDELNEVEAKLLSDKDYFSKLVMRMKMLATADAHQTVLNIMREVMSNEVAVQFSFLGAKKKRSFKKLVLYKIVVAATRTKFPELLDVKIADCISKWLVQATLRLSRQRKPLEAALPADETL